LGITGAAALSTGLSSATALDTWFSDGMKHKSPNAGQPESAMAGALRVRLGGENFYQGQSAVSPFLGESFSCPSTKEARQAIRIVAVVSVLGILTALLFGRKR
jgi:adenosylcobinamide-phosphate synthase